MIEREISVSSCLLILKSRKRLHPASSDAVEPHIVELKLVYPCRVYLEEPRSIVVVVNLCVGTLCLYCVYS